jgi:uncharacterized protein YcfJ
VRLAAIAVGAAIGTLVGMAVGLLTGSGVAAVAVGASALTGCLVEAWVLGPRVRQRPHTR